MEIKDRLKAARQHAGLTQSELAKLAKVDQSVVSNIERGIASSSKKLPQMASICGVSVDWLTLGKGEMLAIVSAPLIEKSINGIKGSIRTLKILGIAQLDPDGYWDGFEHAEGYIDVPSEDNDAYALILRGDSMMPAIRSGWVAWCEPCKALVPLEYVMIKLKDGQCMIKELIKETAHDVTVQSINQDYGRMTINRRDIESIHYVGGIVPPSKIREAEPV